MTRISSILVLNIFFLFGVACDSEINNLRNHGNKKIASDAIKLAESKMPDVSDVCPRNFSGQYGLNTREDLVFLMESQSSLDLENGVVKCSYPRGPKEKKAYSCPSGQNIDRFTDGRFSGDSWKWERGEHDGVKFVSCYLYIVDNGTKKSQIDPSIDLCPRVFSGQLEGRDPMKGALLGLPYSWADEESGQLHCSYPSKEGQSIQSCPDSRDIDRRSVGRFSGEWFGPRQYSQTPDGIKYHTCSYNITENGSSGGGNSDGGADDGGSNGGGSDGGGSGDGNSNDDELSLTDAEKEILSLLRDRDNYNENPNVAVFYENTCGLCERGYPVRNVYATSDGKSCHELDDYVIKNVYVDSLECKRIAKLSQQQCCDQSFDPIAIPGFGLDPGDDNKLAFYKSEEDFLANNKRNIKERGAEPVCNICIENNNFPGKPHTILTVSYVSGNPTCEEAYWMGLTGHIQGSMCYPLQLFIRDRAGDPCGCKNNQ